VLTAPAGEQRQIEENLVGLSFIAARIRPALFKDR
jgi:hypothetical protein